MQNTAKIVRCETYLSYWGCLIAVNMQLFLETSSPQWANTVPNLPGANYVVKNWALVMILKASLPSAHFSSVLLLKEQMIISVKKKWKMLIKLAQNRSINYFYQNLPWTFPWNWSFFTDCFSVKFAPKIPQKSANFSVNLLHYGIAPVETRR